MQITNNSNVAFGTRIPVEIESILYNSAFKQNRKVLKGLTKKLSEVRSWGVSDSSLILTKKVKSDNFCFALSLDTFCGNVKTDIDYHRKKTLLATFLSLSKTDILEAEYKLLLAAEKLKKNFQIPKIVKFQ